MGLLSDKEKNHAEGNTRIYIANRSNTFSLAILRIGRNGPVDQVASFFAKNIPEASVRRRRRGPRYLFAILYILLRKPRRICTLPGNSFVWWYNEGSEKHFLGRTSFAFTTKTNIFNATQYNKYSVYKYLKHSHNCAKYIIH